MFCEGSFGPTLSLFLFWFDLCDRNEWTTSQRVFMSSIIALDKLFGMLRNLRSQSFGRRMAEQRYSKSTRIVASRSTLPTDLRTKRVPKTSSSSWRKVGLTPRWESFDVRLRKFIVSGYARWRRLIIWSRKSRCGSFNGVDFQNSLGLFAVEECVQFQRNIAQLHSRTLMQR